MSNIVKIIFCAILLTSITCDRAYVFAQSVPNASGPTIDCKGSAKAYRLQGIPCYCRNGQIVCDQPSSNPSESSSKKGLSYKNQMKLQVMESVTDAAANSFIKWINGPTPKEQQKAALAAAQAAAIAAENQRIQDAKAQAKHDKMMRSFVTLDNSQGVAFKTLSNSNLDFKTLDSNTETLAASARDSFTDQLVRKEQDEFENMNAEWMKKQKQLIEGRLKEPNKYASALYKSLKTNVPPLPWKTKPFNELKPGDVLLFEGKAISSVDNKISNRNVGSRAAHTVLYLKEVNGKKLFLDNQPDEGPRIISEDEFVRLYGHRGADVATLAEPLKPEQGKKLFSAAVAMAQKNNKELVNKNSWFGKYLLTDTNYGVGGANDVVCSEADWAVINAAGRTIPFSDSKLKLFLGLKFTPSDFYNSPYFMVTRLW